MLKLSRHLLRYSSEITRSYSSQSDTLKIKNLGESLIKSKENEVLAKRKINDIQVQGSGITPGKMAIASLMGGVGGVFACLAADSVINELFRIYPPLSLRHPVFSDPALLVTFDLAFFLGVFKTSLGVLDILNNPLFEKNQRDNYVRAVKELYMYKKNTGDISIQLQDALISTRPPDIFPELY